MSFSWGSINELTCAQVGRLLYAPLPGRVVLGAVPVTDGHAQPLHVGQRGHVLGVAVDEQVGGCMSSHQVPSATKVLS